MRYLVASLAALSIAGACGASRAPTRTSTHAVEPAVRSTVSGRVLGYDGRPLRSGHAALRIPDGRATELRVPLGADGSFEIEAVTEGFAWLELSGVAHAPLTMPVVLDARTQRLDIRLGTNRYRDDFSELRLVVRHGGRQRFARAQPRADGRYEAFVQGVEGQVRLSWASALSGCCGETAAGRAEESPPGLGWEADGAGRYRWTQQVRGRTRIVFDPERLPPTGREAEVTFAEPDGPLARVFAIEAEVRRVEQAHADAIASAATRGRDAAQRAATEFPWGAELRPLAQRIEAEEDPQVRRVALAAYFARLAASRPSARERVIAGWALEEVPPGDAAWAWGRVATVLRTLGDTPAAHAYAARVVAENPELDVVSQALWIQATSEGVSAEDRTRAERALGGPAFAQTFGGTRLALRRAESGLARTLPALELEDLDSAQVLSNDAFRNGLHLLSFWATWCEPCMDEMPDLHRLHERFDAAGLTIVSVAVDDEPHSIAAFRDGRWPMPWTHARIDGAGQEALTDALGVRAELPMAILVDERGRVVVAGPPHLVHGRVERMLAEGESDAGALETELRALPPEKAEAIRRAVRELEALEAAVEAGDG